MNNLRNLPASPVTYDTYGLPLTDEAAMLPAMNGSGRVRSLQESASLSPALTTLLTLYAADGYENEIRRRA